DFGPIDAPGDIAAHLNERAGVVEHGLFLGLATDLLAADAEGVQHRMRSV
ncbi:MAG: ribose-5-phosphate isomerase A, partial [Anaerolineae bacterium]